MFKEDTKDFSSVKKPLTYRFFEIEGPLDSTLCTTEAKVNITISIMSSSYDL